MQKKVLIYIIISALFFGNAVFALQTPEELKKAIDDKNQALLDINNQIDQTQKQLESVQGQSKTLQQELKKIDYTINQVNLNIKSSELNIQKLGLEIESLKYDINDSKSQIEVKKTAISELLKEIQKNDNENLLTVFLKNKSLSESLNEIQSIIDMNSSLAGSINTLQKLNSQLSDKLDQSLAKKTKLASENTNLKNQQIILQSQKTERQSLLAQTKDQEKNYQALASALDKQQASITDEINQLEEQLRLQINPLTLPTQRAGVLAVPVSIKPRITQGYGVTDFVLKNYTASMRKWHNGIDLAGPIGTPILAAESGTVLKVGNQDLYCPKGAYGKFIVIQHENNLTTLYAHLSLQIVKNGDHVERGEIIGYMGKTGWATGSHLHFTVWASSTFSLKQSKVCGLMPVGGDLDPTKYLDLN
jgi:murein DD-endopeptidase MepM/ murein hydrolase activator NlpD